MAHIPLPRRLVIPVAVVVAVLTLLPAPPGRAGQVAAPPGHAGQASAPPPRRAGQAVWPVRPAVVLRDFQAPAVPWGRGHRGIDLVAGRGSPVRSAAAGVVTFAARLAGRGVVVVRHGLLRTTYEPVLAAVGVGDEVVAGQVIGTVATGGGHCGGDPPCLHWGLRKDDTYLDPRLLMGMVRPVLRPPRGP